MLSDTLPQLIKMLKNLDKWLNKATEYAQKKSFDPEVLLQARLAPDQYPLLRQVQIVCDTAKFTAAYLSGQQAPAHPDTEKTMAEVHARIATCLSFLESLAPSALADGAERRISAPWMSGKWVRGDHYLMQLGLPNFYFHLSTAYAILRHNGVELGKMDFIGGLPLNDA